MEILRNPPSGPDLGAISNMPLRLDEGVNVLEEGEPLTAELTDFDPLLRASLAGPFDPSRYLSAEAEIDVRNTSETEAALVTLAIQVSVDGGAWTTVSTATTCKHNVGAGSATVTSQTRRCSIHVPPMILSAWGAPGAAAEEIEIRVVASFDGEADTCSVVVGQEWIRLVELSADPSDFTVLRLSPSGPDVGSVSQLTLRVAEDLAAREGFVTLTGVAQDIDADLRAELAGPFDASHFWGAECDFDVSNESTNQIAQVTISIQAVIDGVAGSVLHSESHNIGANDEDQLRQVRPISVRVPPTSNLNWGSGVAIPNDATLSFRVTALLAAGEADKVHVEVTQAWARITEHSAA